MTYSPSETRMRRPNLTRVSGPGIAAAAVFEPDELSDFDRADQRPAYLEAVRAAPTRRSKPRAFYAVVVVTMIVVIMVAQLLMSIAVSQGAYQLNTLQTQQVRLQRSVQSASQDLESLRSPQHLAANATALGMSYDNNPLYLRLSDGALFGNPAASTAISKGFLGSSTDLVPNATLSGVPLATGPVPSSHAAEAENSSGAGAASAPVDASTVPLENALPTPVTH